MPLYKRLGMGWIFKRNGKATHCKKRFSSSGAAGRRVTVTVPRAPQRALKHDAPRRGGSWSLSVLSHKQASKNKQEHKERMSSAAINKQASSKREQREERRSEAARSVTPDCVPEVYSERFVYEIGYVPTYDGETDMSRPYWWSTTSDFTPSCMRNAH